MSLMNQVRDGGVNDVGPYWSLMLVLVEKVPGRRSVVPCWAERWERAKAETKG